ncbi:hypothetical protein C1J03_09395 [Sulfitobacter sp. SK012]|nr:hypothetical protein C1J03_09395 [Sulfitobacter sp. SK012]
MRVSELSQSGKTPIELRPTKAELATIAQEIKITDLRKLVFTGSLSPHGKSDWELNGHLGATVVQPCVVTLVPVTTRIEVDVLRRFIREYDDPDDPEVQMPEDDTTEVLGAWIDPVAVMTEALTLALPEYPRAADAALSATQFAEPGVTPMTDEDARPFAGLAALKDALEKKPKD